MEFLMRTQILERPGWSAALLTHLLGDPDERVRRRTGPGVLCLYRTDRVLSAEATPAFAQGQATLAKRRATAAKAVQTKAAALLRNIEAMRVDVRVLGERELVRRAVAAHNARNPLADTPASCHSEPSFLERICVNYVRHELTEYDRALESVAGRVGVAQGVAAIRSRIFGAIVAAYPHLAEECDRQLRIRAEADAVRSSWAAGPQP